MKHTKKRLIYLLVLGLSATPFVTTQAYLSEEAYQDVVDGIIYEDRGIVIANYPALGYMTYRNYRGEEVVAHYYSSEMVVEKAPYDEQEDKIGYIDELFPSFTYDARDTTIAHILPGDNIYLRMDKEGYVTYISAFNDYTMRYGRVHTWTMGADGYNTLVLEQENGKLYNYQVPKNIPISKNGGLYSLGRLQEGEWVRLLVSQKILGQGVVQEDIKEIVVDPDSRVIENVYRGELIAANRYQNTLTVKNNQSLNKNGWTGYEMIRQMTMNPSVLKAYFLGNPVALDQIESQLIGAGSYVYVASERYMGQERAIKLNFQRNRQITLPTTQVIYTSPGVIQLLTGERIMLAEDTILVRDNRLVGPASIMVGDTIQPVVTGENKLAVGMLGQDVGMGMYEIFRGRIKQIDDYYTFEVETFSMLADGEWYFHPSPRTFAITADTKLYGTDGIETQGLDIFMMNGEHSKDDEVFTVIGKGDQAAMIIDMPYTKEGVKGYVYSTDEGVKLKDLYTYNTDRDRWEAASGHNVTGELKVAPNTVIIKEGEIVSQAALEQGDKLTIMLEDPLEVSSKDSNVVHQVPAYLVIVD